jgi:hypothetical protein
MMHNPAHDLSRTYRCVFILLGHAALRAGQHVHLLVSAGMRVRCANPADSSTQHQHYHVSSAATLSSGDNRNFVHMKRRGRCGVPLHSWFAKTVCDGGLVRSLFKGNTRASRA